MTLEFETAKAPIAVCLTNRDTGTFLYNDALAVSKEDGRGREIGCEFWAQPLQGPLRVYHYPGNVHQSRPQ